MRINAQEYTLNGHKLVLRNAEKEDAQMLLPYPKRICSESKFMMREADECDNLTIEEEEKFIITHLNNDKACLILAELDDQYVGNASFHVSGPSRRNAHMAEIGIGLYKDFTGMGIGKKLFGFLLEIIEKSGFEAAELYVVEGNIKAIHLYESFGFTETGRVPKANKYDDGSYSDNIYMVKFFK